MLNFKIGLKKKSSFLHAIFIYLFKYNNCSNISLTNEDHLNKIENIRFS